MLEFSRHSFCKGHLINKLPTIKIYPFAANLNLLVSQFTIDSFVNKAKKVLINQYNAKQK